MQRNTETCSHCGKPFVRLTGNTPIVNRSFEKIFHLTLFAGPQPRPKLRGGFFKNQAVCNFSYSHHGLETNADQIVLVILLTQSADPHAIQLAEMAADKLADMVVRGRKLQPIYTLDGEVLVARLPK